MIKFIKINLLKINTMKTNLSPDHLLVKISLLALFLFLMNTFSFAQNKIYASGQANQVIGICIGCGVQNPQNAVGSNENDYSTLSTPLAVISQVEQTLIFPAPIAQTSKIVVGIGTQEILTAQLLSGVSIETFNGNTSNNDHKFISTELLKIDFSNPTNGTIEFITSKPYDRIKIYYYSGILNINGGLRIYYAYQAPLDRIYAASAHNMSEYLCSCSIINSNNAADNDENTYSTLYVEANETKRVKQSLRFTQPPINKTPKKLVFGVGKFFNKDFPSDVNRPISFADLGKLTIDISDASGKYTQTIDVDNSMFKYSPTNPTRATIEIDIAPTDLYSATLTWYNKGTLAAQGLSDELRIYYAYYTYTDIPTMCPPALYPIHYYSFNENILDMPGGNLNLTKVSPNTEIFQNNMICNQGLGYSAAEPETEYTFKGVDYLNVPSPRAPRTVSFWARVDQGGVIDLTMYGEKIKITQDSIIIKPIKEHPKFIKQVSRMFRTNPANPGALNLYVINFNNDPTPAYGTINTLYPTNDKQYPPFYPVDLQVTVNGKGLPGAFPYFTRYDRNHPGNYPDIIETTYWAPYYNQGSDLYNNDFIITFKKAQMDEFVIYDKKISPKLLLSLYPQTNSNPTVTKISPSVEDKVLIISPNPTTSQIALDGNILFTDSDISIKNISGKEVYQSKFKSKTFDLPSTLPGGIYILTVQTKDKKIYTRKIILNR